MASVPKGASRVILAAAAAGLVVGMGYITLNFLRLAFIANIVHPMLLLNMAVLAVLALLGIYYHKRVKPLRIEWALLASLMVTACFTDFGKWPLADIAVDILRPLLFIAAVMVVRSLADMQALANSVMIRRLIITSMWLSVIAVVVCYAVSKHYHVLYPAYSTIDAFLGLGWLVATASPLAQGLYLLVLIVSAKRGVYLAAMAILLLIYYRNRWVLGTVVVGTIAVITAIASMTPLERVQVTAFFVKSNITTLEKLVSKPDFDAYDYIIGVVAGGRLHEAHDAIANLSSPLSYVVGEGFGFSYPSQHFAVDTDRHRNLHFTPLSLMLYYGAIFFVLFLWYLVPAIRTAWSIIRERPDPITLTFAVYFLTALIFSLTEYSIFVYANVAISTGLMLAYKRQRPRLE